MPGIQDFSSAGAINTYGQVLGSSNGIFMWLPTTPNGVTGSMIPTSSLGGGPDIFALGAINSTGQLLGRQPRVYFNTAIALWTPNTPNGTNGTFVDVLSLVDPADLVGWSELGAGALNDRGQIAGTGYYDADGPGNIPAVQRGFLLTPVPEPAALVLIAVGIAIVSAVTRYDTCRRECCWRNNAPAASHC